MCYIIIFVNPFATRVAFLNKFYPIHFAFDKLFFFYLIGLFLEKTLKKVKEGETKGGKFDEFRASNIQDSKNQKPNQLECSETKLAIPSGTTLERNTISPDY